MAASIGTANMSASVRDITTAIVQEIGKRDARIYELELISARDRTDTAALADALRDAEFLLRKLGQLAGPMQDSCQRCASDARALLARVDGDGA
jgi:hypothetical protein